MTKYISSLFLIPVFFLPKGHIFPVLEIKRNVATLFLKKASVADMNLNGFDIKEELRSRKTLALKEKEFKCLSFNATEENRRREKSEKLLLNM